MRAIFSKPTTPASPGQQGVWSFDTLLSPADEGNSRTSRPRNRWKPEQLRRRETSVRRWAEGGHEAQPCCPALKLCAGTASSSAQGKVDGGGTWPGASRLPRSGDGHGNAEPHGNGPVSTGCKLLAGSRGKGAWCLFSW